MTTPEEILREAVGAEVKIVSLIARRKHGQLYLLLPKKWVEELGLERRQRVVLVRGPSGILIDLNYDKYGRLLRDGLHKRLSRPPHDEPAG